MCRSCWEELNGIGNKTLGYYTSGQKYLSSKCQEIRTNARRVLESSEREKVCQYCHNHEFDAILEVHHLKGILEFDEDTLIKEINNENNLVWLCPNHHIMLEKGLISLPYGFESRWRYYVPQQRKLLGYFLFNIINN